MYRLTEVYDEPVDQNVGATLDQPSEILQGRLYRVALLVKF